uniref:NADAR domain-containing protein n=1 Tax=Globodera pallida TaxID=36090 RepID=A0A183CEW3_GLOPA
MVIATPPATMEEGRILLVGNENDILHSAFCFPLNEGGKRYPSADHYAHAQILMQLKLDEVHILELLATSSGNVPRKARELLQANMPHGHDMNSLAQYLITSRQSYTMLGLRLRAEQDKRFRQTLLETGDALLIVCDRRDPELGIGMDDEQFVAFSRQRHANAERISTWMHDEKQRPRELGQNQLGFFLMWLRYELREKEKAGWLSTVEIRTEGLSTDQDEQPVVISVSDFALALQGPFQPLSNYYALPFELKGETYRSVEHYAYQRLFEALKFPSEDVMRLRTTVKPADVAKCAQKVFDKQQVDASEIEHKSNRLDRWRQSAMKHKITKNDYLQKLLLSTGHAILLETTAEADLRWVVGTDEFEIQHLLTKKYVSPQLLVQWMCGRAKVPPSLVHLGGNKTGLLLMELRSKLALGETHRMPLISPITPGTVLRLALSNHMICFTPESVLHPFYPAPIRHSVFAFNGDGDPFPSAVHLVAQMGIKFLGINRGDMEWIMGTPDGPECWERLHSVICEQIQLPLEKIQQWYMDERQRALKEAMKLQFDQHPALLRVLLDTQDAFLVCCCRFSSVEAELYVGMRERDLRLWLTHLRQSTKQLMDLCVRPMAFRPPFFGGNRLGLLLMELRREFILAGVFPNQLPELPLNVDTILGSDSPMENFAATSSFDVLSPLNFTALWANPYLLMTKHQGDGSAAGAIAVNAEVLEQNWTNALSKKQPPLLISRDDSLIENAFARMFTSENGLTNGALSSENGFSDGDCSFDEMSHEMLRTLYIKMSSQFRTKMGELDDLQQHISVRSRDSSRLQELRRTLERTRDQLEKSSSGQTPSALSNAPLQNTPLSMHQNEPVIGGPPPTSNAPLTMNAQWTQAAAISSGHLQRPPPFPPRMDHHTLHGNIRDELPIQDGTPQLRPLQLHPPFQHCQMSSGRTDGHPIEGAAVPSGKIPSLFSQELSSMPSAAHHPVSSQRRHTPPPPPHKRDYPPLPYGQSEESRRGRWERGANGRRGRRGGPGGRPSDRSISPSYGRRSGARILVSPVRVTGANAVEPERQREYLSSKELVKQQHHRLLQSRRRVFPQPKGSCPIAKSYNSRRQNARNG